MTDVTCELFVLSDYANISQDQKLSILGIFDQFFIANLPANWSRMFLVAVVKGTPQKEYTFILKIAPPGKTDQSFPDKDFQISIGPNGKSNLITELDNFPLPLAGKYTVSLENEGKPLALLEFVVNKTTASYDGKKTVN